MIEIRDVTYHYLTGLSPALDQVSLSIQSGDLFGLLGPNGAGKTTLISLLTGLLKAKSGSIFCDGLDINRDRLAVQKKIAWVPQDYAFYPSMSVRENLRFFAGAQRISGEVQAARIDTAAQITGLTQVMDDRAATFSGGLKRRLNVAISLLGEPDYLFLDEPTVGIDPQSRRFILETIRTINKSGTTVVYSSHYMEELESLCNQIAIIDRGRILTTGSLQELLGRDKANTVSISLKSKLPVNVELPASITVSENRMSLDANDMVLDDIGQLLRSLAVREVKVNRMVSGTKNLEHLFLELTDRSLRD